MKKALVFITVLFFSITVTAQDATNDATWEETITFIKKYENKITFFGISDVAYGRKYESFNFEIKNNNKMYVSSDSNSYVFNTAFDLELITDVYGYDNEISIKFLRATEVSYDKKIYANWLRKMIWSKDRTINSSEVKIGYISDSEFFPRIRKAWQHLAYLAIKKREEARKASGDKF